MAGGGEQRSRDGAGVGPSSAGPADPPDDLPVAEVGPYDEIAFTGAAAPFQSFEDERDEGADVDDGQTAGGVSGGRWRGVVASAGARARRNPTAPTDETWMRRSTPVARQDSATDRAPSS